MQPDVAEQVGACVACGNDQVAVMQYAAAYPLDPAEANLRVLEVLALQFGGVLGFSDHVHSNAPACAAAAYGAPAFEKHFTLNRTSPGPDHSSALEPAHFVADVRDIHEASLSIGTTKKALLPMERLEGWRDGLYAARNLPAGTVIVADDLTVRRRALRLRRKQMPLAIGARTLRDIPLDAPIMGEDLEMSGRRQRVAPGAPYG